MKMIFTTKKYRTCFVKVPNYFDYDGVPELLEKVKTVMPLDDQPRDETVVLHGDDWLTDDEHKQLDTDGKIVRPMTEIQV